MARFQKRRNLVHVLLENELVPLRSFLAKGLLTWGSWVPCVRILSLAATSEDQSISGFTSLTRSILGAKAGDMNC